MKVFRNRNIDFNCSKLLQNHWC